MIKCIECDIKRYYATDKPKTYREKVYTFFNMSLLVIISYRFGKYIRDKFHIILIKQFLMITSRIIHSMLCILSGIKIDFETDIGPGLYIGHSGMLIINPKAIIGSNCNIGVGVVIGKGGRGGNAGIPVIGDCVNIGVGAKIIGNITIGDYVTVGANAVVTKSVPNNATVAGVPARIINYKGSKDFIDT